MKARRQKCQARISDGSRQCERWAINGSTVCATHGGRAPQVMKSAKERLAELIEPALEGLHIALKSGEIPSILKAAQIVLDRTGFHPSQVIELSGKDDGPIEAQNIIPIEKLSITLRTALLLELKAVEQGADFGREDSPFITPTESLDKWHPGGT